MTLYQKYDHIDNPPEGSIYVPDSYEDPWLTMVPVNIVNRDQVPNWWIEHDAHAILGAKLGTIEAGWRYFCGLVGVAITVAIEDNNE